MSHLVRSIFAFALLLLSATPMSGQPLSVPQGPITLEALLETALANNRSLKIADALAAKAREDADSARTRQFPNLDLRLFEGPVSEFDFMFRAGSFGTFESTGPVPPADTKVNNPSRLSTVVQFEFSQPLTQLFRIKATVRQLETEQAALEERRRGRAQDVANDVRRQYYAVLEAQSGVAASDAGVAWYRELARLAGQQVDAQTAFEAEALGVRAELARRELEGTVLRNTLATQKQQLGLLVGRDIDPESPLAAFDGLPPPAVDAATIHARALQQRSEIREAQLRVQQAQHGVSAREAERIPDVSLTVRFLGLHNIEVLPPTVAAVGLSLAWQPFDWGRKRRDIAASGQQLTQASLALQETQAQIKVDVDARYRHLAEARARIAVADLARRAAAEQLRLVQTRFEAQSALRGDVLRAEAARAEADRDYRRAVLACWTADADLKRAIGEM